MAAKPFCCRMKISFEFCRRETAIQYVLHHSWAWRLGLSNILRIFWPVTYSRYPFLMTDWCHRGGHSITTWLRFFDHLPIYLYVDFFFYKNGHFWTTYLPTSSCPRSYWTTRGSSLTASITTSRVCKGF